MSRLAPDLRRRLDALSRRAHAFHRYAHHPLCGAYAHEVIRLPGRWRVCRGCTFVTLGGLMGLLLGALVPVLSVGQWTLSLLGWSVQSLWAVSSRRGRRRPKSVTRLLPSLVGVALLLLGVRAGGVTALAAVVLFALVAVGALWRYRRRGPDQGPCATCPQAPAGPRCEGFRPIRLRERAVMRLSSQWILESARVTSERLRS